MRESATCFHNLEWPAEGACLAGPVVWLRGWVVGKPGHDFGDVRVRHEGLTHLGVLGLPRTDLAAHFGSPHAAYIKANGDRFELAGDARAPAGGVLAGLAGLETGYVGRIVGDGTWKRWRGAAAVRRSGAEGGPPLVAFRISNDAGTYGVLGQLRAGLGISDLTGHQAGITHTRIGLGRILFWQLVAVIGNCSFASRVFLAAGCRIRFVLGLGLSNLVVLPGNLVAALLGHHLAKGIALVAQRLKRFVRLHGGRTRGFGNGIGLQQRVGCDRHRAVSAPETKIIGAETGKTRANSRISQPRYLAPRRGRSAEPPYIQGRCG